MTMELLQCDHLERKLKLVFAHTVSKLGSPVSSRSLSSTVVFLYQKIILNTCCNTSESCTYYRFYVKLLTDRQTNRQTHKRRVKHYLLVEVIKVLIYFMFHSQHSRLNSYLQTTKCCRQWCPISPVLSMRHWPRLGLLSQCSRLFDFDILVCYVLPATLPCMYLIL